MFGANANTEISVKKVVIIKLSADFCDLSFTDSGITFRNSQSDALRIWFLLIMIKRRYYNG